MAFCEKAVDQFQVTGPTGALVLHRPVPLETMSCKGVNYQSVGTRDLARRVYILDPEQPLAIGLSRLKVARNGSDERTKMQWAGRRGRETTAVRRLTGGERLV